MALYLLTRQCTKLGSIPRIARQLRTFNKSIYIPSVVLGIKNTLKNEVQIARYISLTASKLAVKTCPEPKVVSSTGGANSTGGASSHSGNHSPIWYAERVLSFFLLLLLPAAIAAPCPALDYTLAVVMVAHAHWGIEAIVTDYVRPIIFGNAVPKICHILIILLSAVTLAGLINFTYNDVGIGEAVRMLWAIKPAGSSEEPSEN